MKERTSVILLNWNELDVSKDSVRRLLKEPVLEVIVIDNGSTDGSKEFFRSIKDPKFKLIDLPENMGSSVGRNKGIDLSKGEFIFSIDGDILFVKGTIREYEKILDKYQDAYCVGQNSSALLAEYGHNGLPDMMEADFSMDTDYTITEGFPMIWCQYGTFRGDILRKVRFIDTPPFDSFFYGFEDDWMYHEIKELGYVSLAVDKPLYYHSAHSGIKEIQRIHGEKAFNKKFADCKRVFEKRWGKNNSWSDTINKGISLIVRDK